MTTHHDLDLLLIARRASADGGARRMREKARLSTREVAAAVGTTAATISRWETAARRPSGAPAVRWAKLLKHLGEVDL